MKWIATLVTIAAVFVMGCTITVKPIPTTKTTKRGKSRSHHSRHHASSVRKPVMPKPPPDSPNIKETWWIENYKKLEAAHGDYQISDDAKIEPLPDGRFRVPDTVLQHYQDLLMAKPTPKP